MTVMLALTAERRVGVLQHCRIQSFDIPLGIYLPEEPARNHPDFGRTVADGCVLLLRA